MTIRWTPEIDARLGKESDVSVAISIGVSDVSVRSRRRLLGIPKFSESANVQGDSIAEAVSHGGSLYKVARKFGVSPGVVTTEMIRQGRMPSPIIKPNNITLSDMKDFINWETCTDAQISHVLKFTRERVRQIRAGLKIAPSGVRFKRAGVIEFEAWAIERQDDLAKMTIDEIVSKFASDISANAARNCLHRLGFHYQHKNNNQSRPWAEIDWRIPNRFLVEIWKVPSIPQQRSRFRKGPSLWAHHGAPDAELWALITAEKSKAAQWFADNPRRNELEAAHA